MISALQFIQEPIPITDRKILCPYCDSEIKLTETFDDYQEYECSGCGRDIIFPKGFFNTTLYPRDDAL